MAVTVTVVSTDRTSKVHIPSSLTFERGLGNLGTLRLSFVDSSGTPYRPDMLESVHVDDGATVMFGGLIQALNERPLGEPDIGNLISIDASDYSTYADRISSVNVTFAADRGDKSIKYIFNYLVTTYLNGFGTSLDAGMATGPDISGEVKFVNVTVRDAFNYVCALVGWVWRFTTTNVVECFAPGTEATPTTLSPSNSNVIKTAWSKQLGQYRNKQYVVYNGGSVSASDATEIAAHGLVEKTVEASDIEDATTAQTLADGLIRMYAHFPKMVDIETFTSGFDAGQQGTITVPDRGINATHLIQSARYTYEYTQTGERWRIRLEAIEGDEKWGSWVDLWRAMVGKGMTASSGGSISGGFPGSVPVNIPPIPYSLGGSKQIGFVSSSWVNIPDAKVIQVNGDDYPTLTTRRVHCERLSLNGVTTVQVRLFDLDAVQSVGSGNTTAPATWTEDIFSVTIASGDHHYVLQMQGGDALGEIRVIGDLYFE